MQEHHALTALILLVALGFYALGLKSGVTVTFVVGGALELWFWGARHAQTGCQSRIAFPLRTESKAVIKSLLN